MGADRKRISVVYMTETGEMARRGFYSVNLAKKFASRHTGSYLEIDGQNSNEGG